MCLGHARDDRVWLSVVERIDWNLWPSDGGTSSGWELPGKMDSVSIDGRANIGLWWLGLVSVGLW